MRRRFLQFSLRGLLGFAALVCLALGGWHLLHAYGNRIEVVGALAVGKPIVVKGRVVRVFGPPRRWIQVSSSNDDDEIDGPGRANWVSRSWLCLYEFDFELGPMESPGEWTIRVDQTKSPDYRGPLPDPHFKPLTSKKFKVTAKQLDQMPDLTESPVP